VLAADDAGVAYPPDLKGARISSSTRLTQKTRRQSCPSAPKRRKTLALAGVMLSVGLAALVLLAGGAAAGESLPRDEPLRVGTDSTR